MLPCDRCWPSLAADMPQLQEFTEASTEELLRAYATEKGIKAGALINGARVALTGQAVAPSLFAVMLCLGQQTVAHRLELRQQQLRQLVSGRSWHRPFQLHQFFNKFLGDIRRNPVVLMHQRPGIQNGLRLMQRRVGPSAQKIVQWESRRPRSRDFSMAAFQSLESYSGCLPASSRADGTTGMYCRDCR